MANTDAVISGVTKRVIEDKIFYIGAKIVVLDVSAVSAGDQTIQRFYADSPVAVFPTELKNDSQKFSEITDQQGETDLIGYVENYLIPSGFFFDSDSGGGGGTSDVNIVSQTAGLALESKQDIGNASLASIDGKIATAENQLLALNSFTEFEKRQLSYLSNIAELLRINNALLMGIAE